MGAQFVNVINKGKLLETLEFRWWSSWDEFVW